LIQGPRFRGSRPFHDAKVFPTMSSDKRLLTFTVVSCLVVLSLQYAMVRTGLIKPEQPDPLAVAPLDPAKERAKALKDPTDLPDNVFAAEVAPALEPKKPETAFAFPGELVLGSDADDSPSAYHLRLQLDQVGAAVAIATTAKYDAEYDRKGPVIPGRKPRLRLIDQGLSNGPGSLAMTVISEGRREKAIVVDNEDANAEPPIEAQIDLKVWEVVRDKQGTPAVKVVTRTDPVTKQPVEGQEIAVRIKAVDPSVTVTKTYRLWKGEDGFEVDLGFSSPVKESKFTYRLFTPHGIPIEGAWYTSTFRDVFFGQVNASGRTELSKPLASTEIIKYKGDPSTYRYTELPLKFAGVEDQYFTTFLEPWPIPKRSDDRLEKESAPFIFDENLKEPQFSDVGVQVVSRPITVGPNLGEIVHRYKVFAGPKLGTLLTPYEAEDLASYRKQWIPIPYASELARYVIAPLLDKIYSLTQAVAGLFGWKNGNYGIAIIFLTMTVRLIMFPISRKQAMMAKKMQDLQPYLVEIKEKYKDDKEASTRETMALWKRHKVNPAAGCLPALIQMPIFVGLWQCLNNSVALRHSKFLYIQDLAAPDMVMHLPFTIPFINAEYLNILPFGVVALMLVQTKLFAPPPTTPEAEMNQKMMKYMMIFMAFMFYKVPSGLGLYFITSSLWQICERLLLPKMIKQPKEVDHGEELPGDRKGPGGPGPNGKGPGGPGPNGKDPGPNGNGKPQGWLGKKIEKLLEEAAKDTTIRNADVGGVGSRDREKERERERERERDRDRSRPRPKPGKRR
jgi:YidC/Oxa1 family membrane protein insertase